MNSRAYILDPCIQEFSSWNQCKNSSLEAELICLWFRINPVIVEGFGKEQLAGNWKELCGLASCWEKDDSALQFIQETNESVHKICGFSAFRVCTAHKKKKPLCLQKREPVLVKWENHNVEKMTRWCRKGFLLEIVKNGAIFGQYAKSFFTRIFFYKWNWLWELKW